MHNVTSLDLIFRERAEGEPESRSLGYAHWPELRPMIINKLYQSRSLGYAHWPELG